MAKGSPEGDVVRVVVINKPDEFAARVVGAVAVDEGTTRVAGRDLPRQEVCAALAMVLSVAKDSVAELEIDPHAQEQLLDVFLTSGALAERQKVFFGAAREVRNQAVQKISR